MKIENIKRFIKCWNKPIDAIIEGIDAYGKLIREDLSKLKPLKAKTNDQKTNKK